MGYRLVVACTLVFTSACNDKAGTSDALGDSATIAATDTLASDVQEPDVAASWAALRAAFADALCARDIACGALAEAQRADCRETMLTRNSLIGPVTSGPATDPSREASVLAGRLRIDPVKAEACRAAIAGVACGKVDAFEHPACAEAIVGVVEPGGACASSHDCKDRGRCVGAGGGSYVSACPSPALGTCAPTGTVGSPCTWSTECAAGLFCGGSTCAPLAALGESCSSSEGCVSSAWCDLSQGQCRAPKAAGEGCSYFGPECAAPMSCYEGKCALGFEVAELGEVCDADHACAWFSGLACKDGRCVRRAGLGEICDADGACLSELWCDASGRCARLPTLGEPCPAGTCRGDHVCDVGTCKAPRAIGAPCEFASDCESAYCTSSGPNGDLPRVCACDD